MDKQQVTKAWLCCQILFCSVQLESLDQHQRFSASPLYQGQTFNDLQILQNSDTSFADSLTLLHVRLGTGIQFSSVNRPKRCCCPS